MSQSFRYFAYGSNMPLARLRARLPGAQRLGSARLDDHALAFHKPSDRDGSGKCDVKQARGETAHGVLYELAHEDRERLDRIEGDGYERQEVTVTTDHAVRKVLTAWTYRARVVDGGLQPFDWYHEHVLRGALEASLPAAYIERYIASVAVLRDPDRGRAARELSIYA